MADFCWDCTKRVVGRPPEQNDFVGVSTELDTQAELFPWVLCEGCGFIQVDHTGKRVNPPEKGAQTDE